VSHEISAKLQVAIHWLILGENIFHHGSKSQPLRNYLINLFPLPFCLCVPHHPSTALVRVVRSYRRPSTWASRSWTFNSTPAFPTRRAINSFGIRPSPDQTTNGTAKRRRDTSFGLQVSQFLNYCCGNSWIGRGGPHVWPPRSPEIADTRWTLTAHHRRCCCHTEQSWNHTESNTCWFKTNSLVYSQCRRTFRTASLFSTYVVSQRALNVRRIPFICRWFIYSIKIT
jgi:hypothetical protein